MHDRPATPVPQVSSLVSQASRSQNLLDRNLCSRSRSQSSPSAPRNRLKANVASPASGVLGRDATRGEREQAKEDRVKKIAKKTRLPLSREVLKTLLDEAELRRARGGVDPSRTNKPTSENTADCP